MELSFRENYWDVPELKAEFVRFLHRELGLELSLWDRSGFWDAHYRPFSLFFGDTLVSNVCVYSLEMSVAGRNCRVAQISAVATQPEFRRKGLARQLMQRAMDWARDQHDCFFLFADDDAHAFYKACGFRLTPEYKARISVAGAVARPGAKKLDMQRTDHRELAYRLASHRVPVSDVLGVRNDKLLMFWCLYHLRDHIYHIPDLDALVLFKRDGGLVTVFDIVGTRLPTFADLHPYLGDPQDRAVEFLFMVDKLGLRECDQVEVDGNGTHVCGQFPLEGTRFVFPFTAHA